MCERPSREIENTNLESVANRMAFETDLKKRVTPHVLQHTYGTLIAARGATPQYIRQTMGHADLSSANDYLQYTERN